MEQYEIRTTGPLLNELGELREKGWAKQLLLEYNKQHVKAPWYRRKEWDYYAILTNDYGIALTISDLGYIGYDAITWLDFKHGSFRTWDEMRLFPRGKTALPSTTNHGTSQNKGKKVFLEFQREQGKHELRFSSVTDKAKRIHGELVLTQQPAQDTMVIVTPWKENPKAFYYNQKINCLEAKGQVIIGDEHYDFTNNAYGVLDWGRGVWTYKNTWYWASASGKINEKCFGFNFGYGFGDTSKATENMLFYDGTAHKLDQVQFHFNPKDYMESWRITSNDDRVNLVMHPILDRNSKTNLLLIKSDQHQVFGRFSGEVILDDGRTLKIKDLMGFAEKVFNQW